MFVCLFLLSLCHFRMSWIAIRLDGLFFICVVVVLSRGFFFSWLLFSQRINVITITTNVCYCLIEHTFIWFDCNHVQYMLLFESNSKAKPFTESIFWPSNVYLYVYVCARARARPFLCFSDFNRHRENRKLNWIFVVFFFFQSTWWPEALAQLDILLDRRCLMMHQINTGTYFRNIFPSILLNQIHWNIPYDEFVKSLFVYSSNGLVQLKWSFFNCKCN